MSSPKRSLTGSDRGFWIGLGILGGSYIVLILGLIVADLFFTTPDHLLHALRSPEIRYAIKLSVISCTITTILSLWVAVPLGYLLARTNFRGKGAIDTVLDIPIVLPPLVIGLSLLILFQTLPGRAIEDVTQHRIGFAAVYGFLPAVAALSMVLLMGSAQRARRFLAAAIVAGALVLAFALTPAGAQLSRFIQHRFGARITYAVPSVILAQFSVACAFAARTMRVTFDQISPRAEQVALTLGCTRSQSFWMIAIPQARRGILTAATLAWGRSLGEFGPILIFSGTTRMRTEVLSTSVFLELSIGNLYAAIAVSLLMVMVAIVVLVLTRLFGLRGTGPI